MDRVDGADPFAELKEVGDEYTVYDSHYERVGKVDDLLVDEDERVLYVGVKMGFFGTNSTLIPAEIIRVNDRRRLIEISEPAETIRHAPNFGRSEDLTPELENHVRTYFGLESLRPSPEHDLREPDIPEDLVVRSGPDDRVDTVPGERAELQDQILPQSEDLQDVTSERVELEKPTGAQERAPERARSEEPISERLSKEPEGLIGRLTTRGGVTVHRIRR